MALENTPYDDYRLVLFDYIYYYNLDFTIHRYIHCDEERRLATAKKCGRMRAVKRAHSRGKLRVLATPIAQPRRRIACKAIAVAPPNDIDDWAASLANARRGI